MVAWSVLPPCFSYCVWCHYNTWIVSTKPKRVGNCCSKPNKEKNKEKNEIFGDFWRILIIIFLGVSDKILKRKFDFLIFIYLFWVSAKIFILKEKSCTKGNSFSKNVKRYAPTWTWCCFFKFGTVSNVTSSSWFCKLMQNHNKIAKH